MQNVPLKSPKLRILVRDLPTAGKPADFNGAVGQFDLQTELDQNHTETGNPLTLKINISGDGNLKLLANPELELPPGFEAYDPKIKERGDNKSFEYLLIPNKPGDFVLQPYSFSYFDTEKEQYVQLESPVYNISVSQGEVYAGTSGNAGITKEEVSRLADDIRYLQPGVPRFWYSTKIHFLDLECFISDWQHLFCLPFPYFWLEEKDEQLPATLLLLEIERPEKLAEKRFKTAKQLAAQREKKGFYDELVRALWGYLTDKFGIDPGNLSRAHIREVMEQKGVSSSYVDELEALLDRGEMALFAPISDGSLDTDYETAVETT